MEELHGVIEFFSDSPEATEKIGAKLAKALGEQRFVAFYGTLGAGKTAFIRGMASVLCPAAPVQSPTYTIINEYKKDKRTAMVHVDAYRVNDEDDLYSTGFFDYLDSGAVLVIEWSENIIDFIGDEEIITVDIKRLGDSEREITVERGEG